MNTVKQKLTPEVRKIVGNTGWLFADRILRMALGIIVNVWMARYLGPDQFGLYNYAIAFVLIFSAFATLGLDGIVVRDIVRDPSCKDETLGTAFILRLIGGTITLLLSVGIIALLRPDDSLTHWIVGITAAGAVFQAFDTIDVWFQSQVQAKYTIYARDTALVIVTLVKIALLKMQAPLIAFAWAGFAEIFLGALGLILAYGANGHHLADWRVNIKRGRELFKDSWPLVLSSLAVMLYMKIDQFMLGEMVGNEAVGIYSAATRISELWYFIPTAIVSSVFPSVVDAQKISQQLYYQRLQNLFNLMTGLAYAISIPLSLLSGWVIFLLFGQNYADAGIVLAIHIWASIFVFLGLAQGPWNITEGLTQLSFQRSLIGAVINVLLNLVLIPLYSGVGAAVATVISYAIATFFANALDRRTKIIFSLQIQSLLFFRHLKYKKI